MPEPRYDERVAEVQRWLISTYGSKVTLEVTGKTGWSTMYALTRALQHELGITALSNNFGEGTLSALGTKYPKIGPETRAPNVVRIVQGGMYCKGYDPNGFDGSFGAGCTSAVKSLQRDMGVTADGYLTPKEFKGLLTMDAYVLMPGGAEAARSVQQWLNGKYLGRKNFHVMPCDGLYSRNTQKALVYALQYEIGMDDATANGTFGPGTRSGVRAQGGFGIGASDSTKNWVRLFHGAMIFNRFSVPFDATFSSADSAQVRAFQDFCKLSVTGSADYRTWCSLLVSNGDPDRPGTACDTRVQITPAFAAWLTANGYRTVGRYLTNARVATPLDKEIKPGELATIHGAGLSVFPIYQEVGADAKSFSYWAGYEAATRADAAARGHGIPAGTTIYFAVDFDPTDAQISGAIVPHFKGIAAGMAARGGRYAVGSYGTRNVCQTLFESGLSGLSFVAGMSTGFSGNLGYPLPANWAFDQIFEYSPEPVPGLPLDKDIKSGRDNGFSRLETTSHGPNEELHAYLLWLEVAAHQFAAEHVVAEWETPGMLVSQFVRHREYGDINFDAIMGLMNSEWIEYAKTREASARYAGVPGYRDPMTGQSVYPWRPEHLFVAVEAYLRKGVPVHKNTPYIQDLVGWSGDLVSVLNAYQQAKNDDIAVKVTDFVATTMLAQRPHEDYVVNFGWEDACQDADAYNIAFEYAKDPSQCFADLAMRHINTGGPSLTRNRFRAFVEDRFKTTEYLRNASMEALSTRVVVDPRLIEYELAVAALLALAGPASTKLGDFSVSERESVGRVFAERVIAAM